MIKTIIYFNYYGEGRKEAFISDLENFKKVLTILRVITQENKENPFNSVVWLKANLNSEQQKAGRQPSPKKEPPLCFECFDVKF